MDMWNLGTHWGIAGGPYRSQKYVLQFKKELERRFVNVKDLPSR